MSDGIDDVQLREPITAMNVHLIRVPYDSGQRDLRMGRGPTRFSEQGAADRLRRAGHHVTESVVEVAVSFPLEAGTSFALHGVLSDRVGAAVADGAFPLVLAGNCSTSLGTVSGLRAGTPNDPRDPSPDFVPCPTTTSCSSVRAISIRRKKRCCPDRA
jgi:arginase family enzyme